MIKEIRTGCGSSGFLFWKAVSSPDVRFNKTERVYKIFRKHT